jgi:hypothetical protein
MIRQLAGAMARVPEEATAFGDRSAPWNLSIDAAWEDPVDDAGQHRLGALVGQKRSAFSTGRTYFNFAGLLEEGESLVRTSYGANYDRLVAVKPPTTRRASSG